MSASEVEVEVEVEVQEGPAAVSEGAKSLLVFSYEVDDSSGCVAVSSAGTHPNDGGYAIPIEIYIAPADVERHHDIRIDVRAKDPRERISSFGDTGHPAYVRRSTSPGAYQWAVLKFPASKAGYTVVWDLSSEQPNCKLKISIKLQ